MDNICSICFQSGEQLFHIPGYSFPACSKCSDGISKGIMPNFYQNSRPTMVPTTSSLLTTTLATAASSIADHAQKKSSGNLAYDLEQTLQNMDTEMLMGEEGVCPVCNKAFSRKTTLLNHIRNHSAEKKYVCNYCQKGFTQQANLRNHERIHTNDRPYICIDCGKAFTQITNLNNHRRLHTGERPYVCIEHNCGRSFAQVTNLNNHMKTHHKVQQYVCNMCPKKLNTHSQLTHHLTTHSGQRGFYCPQCPDKTFKQQSHLQQHMKIHGSSFGFSCTKCEEKFLQLSHLEQHMKQHGDYCCTMCSASFNEEGLLKKHIQRHIDGRFSSCPVLGCHESFAMKNQLTKHMQMHHPDHELTKKIGAKKGPRPSTIQVPAASAVAATLATQIRFNCAFQNCNESFTNQDDMGNHLRNAHGVLLLNNLEPKKPPQPPQQQLQQHVLAVQNENQHHATNYSLIKLENGNVVLNGHPANNQHTLQQHAYQNAIEAVINQHHIAASSSQDNSKKVLSDKLNNKAPQPAAANFFGFNPINPFAAAAAATASPLKLICNYCFNVFKTPQTLSRHIEKFHS